MPEYPPSDLAPAFTLMRYERFTALVRTDFLPAARALGLLRSDEATPDAARPAGGRGDAWIAEPPGGAAVVVRPGRRGGWIGRLVRSRYFAGNRFFDELVATERLRRRGAPVPRPLAAVRRGRAIGYETWLVTERIPGVRPAARTLESLGDEGVEDAMGVLGRTVRALHDAGGDHADLNAWNLLLPADPDADTVGLVIDFDRARVVAPPLSLERAQASLARLRRSLDRLGLGRALASWAAFEAAYRAEVSGAASAGRPGESSPRG